MMSVSSENVDRVGRRERFMKNNFESLSGAEQGAQSGPNTISNQFREGSALQVQFMTSICKYGTYVIQFLK